MDTGVEICLDKKDMTSAVGLVGKAGETCVSSCFVASLLSTPQDPSGMRRVLGPILDKDILESTFLYGQLRDRTAEKIYASGKRNSSFTGLPWAGKL